MTGQRSLRSAARYSPVPEFRPYLAAELPRRSVLSLGRSAASVLSPGKAEEIAERIARRTPGNCRWRYHQAARRPARAGKVTVMLCGFQPGCAVAEQPCLQVTVPAENAALVLAVLAFRHCGPAGASGMTGEETRRLFAYAQAGGRENRRLTKEGTQRYGSKN